MNYKDYTPPMEQDGGSAMEKAESNAALRDFNFLLEQMRTESISGDDADCLLKEAVAAWLCYNHCEIYGNKDGEDIPIAELVCRKSFIDGYMVGYRLRLTGETYGD